MSIKDIAFKSEDMGTKIWALTSTVLALQEAIFNGVFSYKEYEGAFFALACMATEVRAESEALTNDLFAALRAENGGAK